MASSEIGTLKDAALVEIDLEVDIDAKVTEVGVILTKKLQAASLYGRSRAITAMNGVLSGKIDRELLAAANEAAAAGLRAESLDEVYDPGLD